MAVKIVDACSDCIHKDVCKNEGAVGKYFSMIDSSIDEMSDRDGIDIKITCQNYRVDTALLKISTNKAYCC